MIGDFLICIVLKIIHINAIIEKIMFLLRVFMLEKHLISRKAKTYTPKGVSNG